MKPRTYIEYVLDETYKFNLQSSIFNKIYNFNRSIKIELNKNNICCYFHDLCAKRKCSNKNDSREDKKLNYFGKKVGRRYFFYTGS